MIDKEGMRESPQECTGHNRRSFSHSIGTRVNEVWCQLQYPAANKGNFVTYRNSTNNSGSDCDNEEDSDGNNDEGDGAKTRTHDEPGKLVNHEIKEYYGYC